MRNVATLFILSAAVVAIVCFTLVNAAHSPNAALAYGFAGGFVLQLLHMIRGALGDLAIGRRVNGEMDTRIQNAVTQAVEPIHRDLEAIKRQIGSPQQTAGSPPPA